MTCKQDTAFLPKFGYPLIRGFRRIKQYLHLILKERVVKKGGILQRSEELNSKVYFVDPGLLRSYAIDQNGKENTFMLAPEGWVIADSDPTTPTTPVTQSP